jgi:dihydroorotase
MDLGAQVGDPGFEHREDLETASAAAAAGGYTAVAPFPNTAPPVAGKAEVAYLLSRSNNGLVQFHPIGTVSEEGLGKQIAELMDMARAGAVGFSDGRYPVRHSGLMLRALQYVRSFNGLIINGPLDEELAFDGQVHEGLVGIEMGLRGIPALAEEMMVQRDISLNAYAGSRIHIYGISTAGSVALIRTAKAQGMDLTCSVPALNLAYDENAVRDYEVNFKVLPPLRGAEDREALLGGVLDGTIDLIVSNHVPLEAEQKLLEFPYAEFGALGLETAYGVINTALSGRLDVERIVRILAVQPRKILGLPIPCIQEGAQANLTFFNPRLSWKVRAERFFSKSRNTPLEGQVLKGKVLGVINNRQEWWWGGSEAI